MRKQSLIFILIWITITLWSCKKEKIVEIEKTYKWKKQASFIYNDVTVMNSFATTNCLYLIGNSFYSLSDTINNDIVNGGNLMRYLLPGEFDINYKMPINKDFFVNISDFSSIGITPSANPYMNNPSLYISPKKRDNKFYNYQLVSYMNGESFRINEKNQFIVPYYAQDEDGSMGSTVSYFLISVKLIKDYADYDKIDTFATKIIRFPVSYSVSNIFSNKDYFIVSMNKTYKIYTDGTSKMLDIALGNLFQKNDTIYGIDYNKTMYISTNDGENWSEFASVPSDFVRLKFYLINNEIIGTYYSHIYHIIINKNDFIVKDIDNDGLIGNYITSISNFKDKIYVTSLSGVYYRNIKDFFTYIQDKQTK